VNGCIDKAGGGGAPPLPKLKKDTSEQTIKYRGKISACRDTPVTAPV
jgi:hypothetical protein